MKYLSFIAHLRKLKEQTLTVYYAARDPRTPFVVRVIAVIIAAYALSPIDLIPDFIPIVGYLDDLILLPLALSLVVRLTPLDVVESAKLKASQTASKPVSYSAAAFILIFWLFMIWQISNWALNAFSILTK